MEKIDLDKITQICEEYSSDGYYPRDLISKKKWTNIFSEFRLPEKISIIAIIDTTLFKSGKRGVIIANSGIYIRNSWGTNPKFGFIHWSEFGKLEVELSGKYDIRLGTDILIDMAGNKFVKEGTINFFRQIQQVLLNPIQSDRYDDQISEALSLADHSISEWTNNNDDTYIDVNQASQEELLAHLGLGIGCTQKIIQQREAMGGFTSIEEIGQLLDLKPHQVMKLKDQITFTPVLSKVKTRIIDY